MLARESDVSLAVECLKLGATDFIEKSKGDSIEKITVAIYKTDKMQREKDEGDSDKQPDLRILFSRNFEAFSKLPEFPTSLLVPDV